MKPSTVPKKPCQVSGCTNLQAGRHPQCPDHLQRVNVFGAAKVPPLSSPMRAPYVRAAQALLKKLVRHKDSRVMLHLNELHIRLKCQLERLPLVGYKALHPKQKASAVLWAIYLRFEDDAALILTATLLGTFMTLKYEPGVSDDPTFGRYAAMRAINHLVKAQPTGLSWVKPYRPRITGKWTLANLERLCIHDARALFNDLGDTFQRDALRYVLAHPKPIRAIRIYKPTKKDKQP